MGGHRESRTPRNKLFRRQAIRSSNRSEGSKGSFQSFGLNKNILRGVAAAGFEAPRPIQAKAIPAALDGRDVLGLAQTGTGKTAAFALPILERLVQTRGKTPRALIVAPTRELAMQIQAEIELLAKFTNVRAITIFGGVGAEPQKRALRAQPHIIVACPGRLLDLMGGGHVKLDGIEVLVLDEADHMFDMGFLPDIKRILSQLPARRQNLLFSATMPREIRKLADAVLRKPHVVELADSSPAETIEHALYPISKERKTALLRHLLDGDDFRSAIVFLRTKHRAKRLARDLERVGHRAIALQGNMSQSQRQRAMQGFREGRYDVLVATDIAARGIDVANVSHVINYDVPNTPDAYTHRIGRTGRSEKSGMAATFVTHEDFSAIKDIERRIGMQIPRIKLREFQGGDQAGRRSGGDGDRAGFRRGFKGRDGTTKRNRNGRGRAALGKGRGGPKRRETAEAAPERSFGTGVSGRVSNAERGVKSSPNGGGRAKKRGISSPAPAFGAGVRSHGRGR
ncbi:MAG TPA: DEAD/DEAH box helicase [Planctomycetes bacterium]|nr:DEAD/DEAH box helicase [Planctomycetota bacterium]